MKDVLGYVSYDVCRGDGERLTANLTKILTVRDLNKDTPRGEGYARDKSDMGRVMKTI